MVATFEHPKLGALFCIALVFYLFLGGSYQKTGMDHRLHEKCSAGCKRQENGFPVRSTYASIALDKQSNLNCGAKFSLYKDIT
jgi:hypothetical protein